jgi:hypothetical protein
VICDQRDIIAGLAPPSSFPAIIVARDNTKPDRIATEFMNAFARNSSFGP